MKQTTVPEGAAAVETRHPASFRFRAPDDMHVHLRQGDALAAYARTVAGVFQRAVVMPNTVPPITTPEKLSGYRDAIVAAAPGLLPLMTFKLIPGLTPDSVPLLREAGAVAGKLYPAGVTTNAEDGVSNVRVMDGVFRAMETEGLVLCIHAEDPDAFCLDREEAFIPTVAGIAERHPALRIVVEHVSSAAMTEFVHRAGERVGATVTAHHLLYTLDDLIGNALDPHLFCKPVVKGPEDRRAVRKFVLEGHPRFFFGSDSAPHPRSAKECGAGASGVYSAPTAAAAVVELFDAAGDARAVEGFMSRFGAEFYGLELNSAQVTAVREAWEVPPEVDGCVPMCAASTLTWRINNTLVP